MTIKKAFLAVLTGAVLLAAPVNAVELTKNDVEQIVRNYLIKNPELLVEMSDALRSKQESQQVENDKRLIGTYQKQLLDNQDPEMGNPKGSLTVVEFFDYNCGYCKRAHNLVQQLMEDDKDIRYIAKQFPILSEVSLLAARAALAVKFSEPAKYQTFHDKLYTHAGPLTDEGQIKAVAKEVGLDWGKLQKHMSDERIDENLAVNRQLAQALSISGTPAFIVGDQIIRGAPRDLAALKSVISSVRESKKAAK